MDILLGFLLIAIIGFAVLHLAADLIWWPMGLIIDRLEIRRLRREGVYDDQWLSDHYTTLRNVRKAARR